jgi:hypothetical protein
MQEKVALPKKLNPGDLIISYDGNMCGLLQEIRRDYLDPKRKHKRHAIIFWHILWLKGNPYPDPNGIGFRDTKLREEIGAGYWHHFKVKN